MATPWIVVGLLGTLVAVAELVSRYRDDPFKALISLPSVLYVVVNLAGSLAAFFLIRQFGWDFGASSSTIEITQVLVAGFGSAAIFRSSLFNVTAGDQVIGVGPSAVLDVILSAADRAVDRKQAFARSEKTASSMDGISFARGADALAMYCFAAMQNTSPVEVQAVDDRISTLRDPKYDGIPDQVKSFVLGLTLATVVGDKVLSDASSRVKEVLPQLTDEPAVEPEEVAISEESEANILQILDDRGPLGTDVLQKEAGVSITRFGPMIDSLVDRGLIVRYARGEDEVVELA